MKTSFLPIVAALLLIPFFSCRKEVSTEKPGGFAGNFTAQIDGAEWIAADSTEGATIMQGLINIIGVSVDNKEVSITLNDTVPGIYQLDQNSISFGAYQDLDSLSIYSYATLEGRDTTQGGGQVTISSIDKVNKTISGTFSFNVYRDVDSKGKKITQGTFYKLPYISSLPQANGTDTMMATIDGNKWSASSIEGLNLSGQLLIIGSQLNGNQNISLTIPTTAIPNSYPLNYLGNTYFGVYSPTVRANFASTNGTILVLENNAVTKRVRGTFQFSAVNPVNPGSALHLVSNGYFSISYQ